jgi:transposase InsO family protein
LEGDGQDGGGEHGPPEAGDRPHKRRRGLTRPDKGAVPFPDLVRRDFSAPGPNVKWCGDMTEIPTREGRLYLADVEDLFSRRIVGFAIGEHPDAELAKAALQTAVAVRGGTVAGVIFHSDRGSTYTADLFTSACEHHEVRQSMGQVGSCLDCNAAAESFFSTLEHELLSRTTFRTKEEARRRVANWIDNYNRRRRHSVCGMKSPIGHGERRARPCARRGEPTGGRIRRRRRGGTLDGGDTDRPDGPPGASRAGRGGNG